MRILGIVIICLIISYPTLAVGDEVNRSGVTIMNNETYNHTIRIENQENVVIENNIFTDIFGLSVHVIDIINSSNIYIRNNTFTDIDAFYASSVTIINIYQSYNVSIIDNLFINLKTSTLNIIKIILSRDVNIKSNEYQHLESDTLHHYHMSETDRIDIRHEYVMNVSGGEYQLVNNLYSDNTHYTENTITNISSGGDLINSLYSNELVITNNIMKLNNTNFMKDLGSQDIEIGGNQLELKNSQFLTLYETIDAIILNNELNDTETKGFVRFNKTRGITIISNNNATASLPEYYMSHVYNSTHIHYNLINDFKNNYTYQVRVNKKIVFQETVNVSVSYTYHHNISDEEVVDINVEFYDNMLYSEHVFDGIIEDLTSTSTPDDTEPPTGIFILVSIILIVLLVYASYFNYTNWMKKKNMA